MLDDIGAGINISWSSIARAEALPHSCPLANAGELNAGNSGVLTAGVDMADEGVTGVILTEGRLTSIVFGGLCTSSIQVEGAGDGVGSLGDPAADRGGVGPVGSSGAVTE